MKTSLSFVCLALAILACAQVADAQNGYFGGAATAGGGQVYEPGAFRPMSGEILTKMPGRFWFETSLADRGLGCRLRQVGSSRLGRGTGLHDLESLLTLLWRGIP